MDGAPPYRGSEVVLNNLFRWLRGRFYRWRGPEFRVREALVWSNAVDLWFRYVDVLEALGDQLEGATVLEVGPAWSGLEFFLPGEGPSPRRLVQADIGPRPLWNGTQWSERILASGAALPFPEDAVDYAIAVDVLEHVPPKARGTFCAELKRVAGRGVITHGPLISGDGLFRAVDTDREFQARYEARFGKPDPFIAQHLEYGYPTPEDLQTYFPDSFLVATVSAADQLSGFLDAHGPLRGLTAGLRFYLRGPQEGPPFYAGLTIWRKPSPR